MGFFQRVREQHGQQGIKMLNEIKATKKKLDALINRRVFLLQCRSRQVFPKHIINNVKCVTKSLSGNKRFLNKVNNIMMKFKKSILNVEISITIDDINEHQNQLSNLKQSAKQILPHELVDEFFSSLHKGNHAKRFGKIKYTQRKKLSNLINEQIGCNLVGNVSNVKNISSKNIPDPVSKLLSLGPKFSIEPTTEEISTKRLLADLEFGIQNLNNDTSEKDKKRAEVVNIVTNFKTSKLNTKDDPLINSQYKDTSKFMKDNDDLVVLNSDKGNMTVILDKETYIDKVKELLSDELTYKSINKDPTESIQRKSNELIKRMYENGHIDKNEKFRLTSYNAVSPKIYGNPKVHKNNNPLRPVVSCIKSPTYNLSKFIDRILNKVTNKFKFNVKNSFQVSKLLMGMILPADHMLVSFDAQSLFTNIKKEAVKDSISKHWDDIQKHTSLPENEFLEIVNFIFDNSYFSFQNKFYQQISGSAMGNPASPAFANLVMFDILKEFENRVGPDLQFLYLYVDDIIACIPRNNLDTCLNILNSISQDVQFTHEIEVNNRIPFLDLLLINNNDVILIDYYKKPSSSNRILNFRSYHPMKQKIGIIKQMLFRIRNLCSQQFIQKNIDSLKELLIQNNYPKNLINRIIHNQNTKRIDERDSNKDKDKYVKVPYHRHLSSKIKHVFKNENTKVAFYNSKTNKQFFGKVKDKVPCNNHSGVVYKVDCTCNKSYVGQTKQYLKNRVQQHERDIRNKSLHTGISQHAVETGHVVKWDSIRILEKEENDEKRRFLEMAHIICGQNLLNKQTDFDSYKGVYNHVLKK